MPHSPAVSSLTQPLHLPSVPPPVLYSADILHDTFERKAPEFVVPRLHRPAHPVSTIHVDDTDPMRLHDACGGIYHLHQQMGKGASGEVWVCTVGKTHEVYALKKVPMSQADDVHREVAAALACRSPVAPEQLMQSVTHMYMVLPLMCGDRELSGALSLGALPRLAREGAALRILVDVLEQVCDLHANRWVHQDIKPANILHRGGQSFLADFGFAVRAEALSSKGGREAAGSSAFMAPEIVDTFIENEELDRRYRSLEAKQKSHPPQHFVELAKAAERGHIHHPYAVDIWSAAMTCLSLLGPNPIEMQVDSKKSRSSSESLQAWHKDYRRWHRGWRVFRWNNTQRDIDKVFSQLTPPMRQLLLTLLHPQPAKRPSAAEALLLARNLSRAYPAEAPDLEIAAHEAAQRLLRRWRSRPVPTA